MGGDRRRSTRRPHPRNEPRELLERAQRQGALISWEPAGAAGAAPEIGLGGCHLLCSDGRVLAGADSPLPSGGAVSLLTDVTEARRNMQALAQARDKAAAADQSKSRFLRAANHDLRQPLASLKILVYSCLVAENEEDRKQALHAMEVSVAIMEDLLGSLLNIGQLDAGKIEPSIATFQISSILTRLGVQFAHRAREKGLDLRIIPSKLAVVSDRVLLERILSNLVGNAIRYTDVARVLVGCRRRGRNLRILVADTGVGIAPQHHEDRLGVHRPCFGFHPVTPDCAPPSPGLRTGLPRRLVLTDEGVALSSCGSRKG